MDFQLEHSCHYNAAASPDLSVTCLSATELPICDGSCHQQETEKAPTWAGK